MKKKVDISVIMAAYNGAAYIRQALDSILCQQFNGTFEILVADDKSTDNTRSIIAEYAEKYPTIVVPIYRDNNLGLSDNIYDVMVHASGTYLAICDNDDYWIDPLKLQKQFDYLETHSDCGMLCGASQMVDENNNVLKIIQTPYVESFRELMNNNSDVIAPSIMLRKEQFMLMVLDSKWYIENHFFLDTAWTYWFSYHNAIHYSSDVQTAYRVRSESESHSKSLDKQVQIDKRYWLFKVHFLLHNNVPHDMSLEILSKEYDILYKNAYYYGSINVRQSKSYRLGYFIKKTLRMK